MKFYNYFSNTDELKNYLKGIFQGKGVYFDPNEFQKKETLRSALKLSYNSTEIFFHLKITKKIEKFKIDINHITDIKEDFCKFSTENNLDIQIQAMTENKLHIHISGNKNGMKIIYISGILYRKRFLGLF